MADSRALKRPFKICNSQRTERKGVVCSSLEELKTISRQQFLLIDGCRVFLECDGTEVDNEEYFQFLAPQTLLMVTDVNESWIKHASGDHDTRTKFDHLSESQESFHGEDQVDNATQHLPVSLHERIKGDPIFFVSLSTEELNSIVDIRVQELQRKFKCTEAKAIFYQESCQQELDRRTELKETTELLRICEKAISRTKEDGLPSKKQKI